MDKEAVKNKIIEQIKTVYDPELPVDLYELGLIYKIEMDDIGTAHIDMTLTTPMCPVADSLPMEVQEKVMAVEEVKDVNLKVVFEPTWNKSMMSEEALLLCDMF